MMISTQNNEEPYSIIYDPCNLIDQETYSSAIVDVIKEVDPSAVTIDIPSPFSEADENNNET